MDPFHKKTAKLVRFIACVSILIIWRRTSWRKQGGVFILVDHEYLAQNSREQRGSKSSIGARVLGLVRTATTAAAAKVLKARKLLRPSEVRRALPVPVPPFSFHYSSFSTIYHVSLFKGLDVISAGLLKLVERRKLSKVDWGHGWPWLMWHIFNINLIRQFWCNSWFFKLLAKHFLM